MSILLPKKYQVSVYSSEDDDSPTLNFKDTNSVVTIMKACLVTGYGSKAAAGWELAFEDLEKHVKVIKPVTGAEQDYYLRLSADDGMQVTSQVYTSMTDVNTGDLKLECAYPFKYGNLSGARKKWILIATDRAFWFFCENAGYAGTVAESQAGCYFFIGEIFDTAGMPALYLKHSSNSAGGAHPVKAFIFSKTHQASGKLFDATNKVFEVNPQCAFLGNENLSGGLLAQQLFLSVNNEIYFLPAFAPSRNDKENYEKIESEGRRFINHGCGTYPSASNLFVPIDFWEM